MLCTSGFTDDVMFLYHGPRGRGVLQVAYQFDVRQLQFSVEFVRMRHRGRSLLSMNVSFDYCVAGRINRPNIEVFILNR